MMPALIGGMAGGALSMVMVKRPMTRLVTIVTAAIGSSLVGSAVIGSWFGMLPGNYWMHALVLGTGALAISAVISGLGTLLGYGGMGLGIIFMMLIGTPWGGVMMPTKFLPDFMGGLGFHMPTGTVVNLMKSVATSPKQRPARSGGHSLPGSPGG